MLLLMSAYFFLTLVGTTFEARILAVVPTPSFSHQITFRQIWRQLSLRGHQVTLITTHPMRDANLLNLTEIDVSFANQIWEKDLQEAIERTAGNPIKFLLHVMEVMHIIMDGIFDAPEVKKLLANKEIHFDIVMIEYLQYAMFAFKHRFNATFIGLISFDPSCFPHSVLGNPCHPITHPDIILGLSGDELTFLERVVSTLFNIAIQITTRFWYIPYENETIAKHFGQHYPNLYDIALDVDMIFLNIHPVLHPARPLVPATLMIGGRLHMEEPKPLPLDLQFYLDQSSRGVIYFSLGGNVKSKDLSNETKQILTNTFSELPYNILWKYEGDNLLEKPDNVKLIKWAPQQDVLRHPNIKVFISQCGLQSTDEAIYSNIPVLAMPFFSDQEHNANVIVSKGFGLLVDYKTMTKEILKNNLIELVENPIYKRAVSQLSKLALDEPMTGLEKAIWWTEYAIRNKGNLKHLKNPAVDLPFYKLYLLDVASFCICTVLLFLYLLFKLFGITRSICVRRYVEKRKWD